jgi:hypothetical protein
MVSSFKHKCSICNQIVSLNSLNLNGKLIKTKFILFTLIILLVFTWLLNCSNGNLIQWINLTQSFSHVILHLYIDYFVLIVHQTRIHKCE